MKESVYTKTCYISHQKWLAYWQINDVSCWHIPSKITGTHLIPHAFHPLYCQLAILYFYKSLLLLCSSCEQMDPCPFLRITIANLAVMLPANRNLPSCVFLDCNIKLKGFPTQVSTINAFPKQDLVIENKIHASFNLNKTDIEKITTRGKTYCLRI